MPAQENRLSDISDNIRYASVFTMQDTWIRQVFELKHLNEQDTESITGFTNCRVNLNNNRHCKKTAKAKAVAYPQRHKLLLQHIYLIKCFVGTVRLVSTQETVLSAKWMGKVQCCLYIIIYEVVKKHRGRMKIQKTLFSFLT